MMAFILTFPSAGSWNGKFSGEGRLYVVTKRLPKEKESELAEKRFTHRWDDGWMALIECRSVDGREAARLRKKTRGFFGYEWMIDSILANGKILSPNSATAEEEKA